MKHFIALLLVCLSIVVSQAAVSFATQPYLQHLTPTSVTVMFVAGGGDQLTGWVEYGTDGCDHRVYQSRHGLREAFGSICTIRLDSLQPGTTYHYRALICDILDPVTNWGLAYGDTIVTPVYTFTTPVEQDTVLQCLVFNDLHGHLDLMDSLLARHHISMEEEDLVLFNGDIIHDIPGPDVLITRFLQPVSRFLNGSKPFVYSRGNHELRHRYARHLIDYIVTPMVGQDVADEVKHYYGSLRWGPCFFIFLDSGDDAADDAERYAGMLDFMAYRTQQQVWLEQQLQSDDCRSARYTIVLMHMPFYSNNSDTHEGIEDCRQKFMPILNRYGVDVVLSGHTHEAAILQANSTHCFPILLGGSYATQWEDRLNCAALMHLRADAQALDINILDFFGRNRGSVHISK